VLGLSVAKIAKQTGTTAAVVRRIVGKLDPAAKERRGKEQEATAARINARSEPWPEKVRRWKAETGQSEATLFRVLERLRSAAER
jgi:hypothetical protein